MNEIKFKIKNNIYTLEQIKKSKPMHNHKIINHIQTLKFILTMNDINNDITNIISNIDKFIIKIGLDSMNR